jgi:hypothetical protein
MHLRSTPLFASDLPGGDRPGRAGSIAEAKVKTRIDAAILTQPPAAEVLPLARRRINSRTRVWSDWPPGGHQAAGRARGRHWSGN